MGNFTDDGDIFDLDEASIMATLTENTGVERMAIITVTSTGHALFSPSTITFTITQRGAAPTLAFTPMDETIAYDAESASNITFNVGGGATGWRSNIVYTPDGADFITLDPDNGGRGDVTVGVVSTVNTGVERNATITFTTTGGTGAPASATVTIRQVALPDYIHVGDVVLTTQEQVDTIRNTLGRATTINANLTIGSSTDITHLDSLYFLTGIRGNFEIRQNSMLEDVGDFPVLDSIGGYFLMHSNSILRNAGDFPVLKHIGGYFLIRASDSLTSIGSFPRLATVGGYFSVRGAKILRSLYEFPALTSIGKGIAWVPSQGNLLANASIVVEDNPLLEYCCVLTRLRAGGGLTISGSRYVNNNFEGCNISDDGDETNCNLSVRLSVDDTVRLPFFSEETTFTLYSNARWQLSKLNPGDADWVTSLSSGVGEGVADNLVGARDTRIRVNHTPNPNSESRMAQLLISFLDTIVATPADTLTLIQSAAPTLVVATNDTTIDHNSGSLSISFTLGGSAVGWEAEITGDAFITLDPAGPNTTATGGVTIMATASANNTGADRMATITFTTTGGATDMVTITQSAAPAPMDHTLVLTSPSTVTLAHDATDAQTIRFDVGGSATGWVASLDQSFVTSIPTSGGVGTWELAIFFTENIGVARAATITITTTGATGAPVSKTIMITQAAAPPVLVLTSGNTVDVLNTETDPSDSIEIMFVVGGGATGWEATVDEGFVTLDKTMGSSGTDTLKVAVTENVGVERSAVITLTTMGGTGSPASATVTIRQEAAPAVPTLTVISNTGTLAHGAGSTFDIVFNVANAMWTAASDQSYVTVSPESGTAGDNLTVTTTAEANTTGSARTATITITATDGTITLTETVTFTQSAAPPPPSLLLFTPSTVTLAHDATTAENITFIVGGSAGGWTAMSSNTNFVTVSPSLGTGETGVIMVTVVGTSAGSRTSDIEITTTGSIGTAVTETVTITQEAVPTLSVDPSSFTLGHDVVDAQNIVVTSGGSATSWTASSDSAFVTFTTSSGVSGDSATFTLSSNGTGSERAAEIVITTGGSLGTAVTETVTITQEEAPTLSVDNSSFTLGHDVVGEQNIMVSVGGSAASWNATSDGAFVTITTSNGGNGDNVTFTLSSNNTGSERTAEIVITTVGSLGNDSTVTVMITQEAAPTLSVDNSSFSLGHDEGDAQNIVVTSGGSATGWTASSDSTFVVFTTSSGVSGGSATFTLSSNDTGSERAAEIVITTEGSLGTAVTETVTITQEESPTLMLSTPTTVGIDYNVTAAQTITFDVGGSATGWDSDTVYSPVGTGFITLTPPMNNAETGTVTVEAKPTENTGAARSVTITFYTTGQLGDSVTAQVTITQGAAPNSPMLMGLSFRSGDTVRIEHNDSTTVTNIGFTAGGNATGWTASSDNSFVTLSSMSGNSTDPVMLMATLTGMNRGVERSATITISTSGPGTSPATATLTITQGGAVPVLTFTPMDETIAHSAESATDITFNVGGGATGWTSSIAYTPDMSSGGEEFITLTPDNTGRGDVVMTVVSTMNTTGVERSAVITITTRGGTGDAKGTTVTITQSAEPSVDTPTLVISTNDTTINHDETGAFNISFMLGGDARGWQSTLTGDDFITLTPGQDARATAGEVTIMATASVNATGSERTQTITFATTGGATDMVIITQRAAPPAAAPTVSISTTDKTIEANDTLAISVAFMVGGNATGWGSTVTGDFITLDTAMNTDQTGEITIQATPTANTGVERVAKIVISTKGPGDAVSDTLTITQSAGPPIFTLTSDDAETIAYDAETASDITFEVGGGATGWEATVIDGDNANNFVMLDKPSGSSGLDTIKVTTTVNTGVARVDTVVVGTGGEGEATDTIIVTQEAVPTIEITDPSDGMITIDYNDISAQTITFNVGGSATGWTASSDNDFVTLDMTSGVSGTGLMATVMENMDVLRAATITITTVGQLGAAKTATVMITQTGAPGSPALEITTPEYTTVAYTATTDSDSVEIAFTVGNAMGWGSMISYGVGEDEFITLSETANVDQTGEVRIKATVTENVGVERSAVITITTTGGTGASATATVTITQAGAPPTLRLISRNRETLAYDETTETAIMFEVGGGATGWRSSIAYTPSVESGFITLNHSSSGSFGATATGTVAIRATPMENTGVERTAVITLTTMGGTGVATNIIIITQESAPTIALSTSHDINIAYNEVSAQLLTFDIGGSATGWIASSDQDFVTLNNVRGDLGTGIEVLATPTINNGVSPRTATITISTTGQLGMGETATVMLTQDGAPASPVLVPLSFTDGDSVLISYDETTETAIMFEVGGGATGWRVSSSNEDFITINPSMGAPGQNISVTAIPEGKNTGVERMAVITLSTLGPESTSLPVTATLTIVQGGASPVLSLTSEARDTLAYDAQTASDITFTLGGGATGWSHEITYSEGSEAFLTLTGDTAMSGEVRVVVASEVNMGMERTATITIKTEGGSGDALDTMITIVQATSPPVLRLISSHREVIAHDRITVINIIFDVVGGATGWEVSVEDDNNFLTVDRRMGVPGENIAVVARSRGLNAGVERSAVVRIRAMRGVGAVVDTFVMITQMGAVPTLSVGNSGGSIAYNSTEATINFSIGGGATGWKVSSIRSQVADENFITSPEVGDVRNVRGDQRLSVTLEENRGLQRLAVITLETVGGTSNAVSADFLVLQDAAPPTLRLTSSDSAFISHDVTRLSDITFEVGGGATGWRAAVIEGNDFLTLSNNRGSSGLGRIRVDVRNNLGLSRTGRISIRTVGGTGSALDTVITIRQGSAPPTLTLTSLDREDLAYDAKTASDITFTLGGGATGWSSEITYSEGSESFLTLTGEEDKRGDVRVVVASKVNTGMERTATVTIKTEGGSGDALDTMITIVQELVPTISVTTSQNISIAYDEDLPQTITFEVGGSATGWTASSDQDFVSLSPMSGDSGSNIKVEATSTINNGSARTATITLSTTGQLGSSATAEVTLLQGAINITVTTQAEVNGLTTILAGATKIDGNLTIGDVEDSTSSRSDITDLTPLRNITHITGNLIIASNGRLSDLRSLTGLQSIGGSLSVINNDSLSTLGDFTRLHSIGGALSVTGNDTLEGLGNFSVLTNLGTGSGVGTFSG